MTTSSSSIDVSSFSTDAKFRTWGSAVSAAISAAGLTQTADTGQINWTTVSKAAGTATKQGYEIWRFNDTLQSTKPIYIRIDYGSNGVTSGNGPLTWFTVGTGTDGAGTITGTNTGALAHGGSTVAPTNTSCPVQACYVATQGYFYLGAGLGLVSAAANHGGWWIVARTCDSSGATTGDGVVIYRESGSASKVVTVNGINFNNSTTFSANAPYAGMLSTGASIATGSVVPMAKHYAAIGAVYNLNQVLSYYSTDITAQATFSSTPWGSSAHTFLAHGANIATSADGSAGTSVIPASLWE